MNANVLRGPILRGPVLPTLLAVGVVIASVAGTVALTGKQSASSSAAKAAKAKAATPPPIRNAAWTAEGAHDAPSLSTLTGFWIGADVVVRGGLDGLHALKRIDGSPAWDLPTPGGGEVCGMSAGVDSDIGIVVAQGTSATRVSGSADCAVVSAVDLATGKVLWTTPSSASFGDPDAGAADYAAVGGMAVIDSDRSTAETAVIGLDLRTGVEKWKHPGDCEHQPHAFAVAGTKVAIAEVCQGSRQPTAKVLDAATGEPVPNAVVPTAAGMGGLERPEFVSVDPVVLTDDGENPNTLRFAGVPAPVHPSGVDSLVTSLTPNSASRSRASVGGGVLCAGGRQVSCWSANGSALTLRGLPNAAAEHHDSYPVLAAGSTDAARVVTTGIPAHPRASLCRITADGGVVVEADLSQAVSEYLGKSGIAGSYYVYGDAKDLFVVDPHPDGRTAVIDVRLS